MEQPARMNGLGDAAVVLLKSKCRGPGAYQSGNESSIGCCINMRGYMISETIGSLVGGDRPREAKRRRSGRQVRTSGWGGWWDLWWLCNEGRASGNCTLVCRHLAAMSLFCQKRTCDVISPKRVWVDWACQRETQTKNSDTGRQKVPWACTAGGCPKPKPKSSCLRLSSCRHLMCISRPRTRLIAGLS